MVSLSTHSVLWQNGRKYLELNYMYNNLSWEHPFIWKSGTVTWSQGELSSFQISHYWDDLNICTDFDRHNLSTTKSPTTNPVQRMNSNSPNLPTTDQVRDAYLFMKRWFIAVTPSLNTAEKSKATQEVANTSSSVFAPHHPPRSSFQKISTRGKVDIRVLGINKGVGNVGLRAGR